MQKFCDIQYERPDFAALSKQCQEFAKKIKKARSYDEFKGLMTDFENATKHAETMLTVSSIRNTANEMDEFYENEEKANAAGGARLQLDTQKVLRAAFRSPYRAEFDKEFGPQLLKTAEMNDRLMSPKIVPQIIKEADLGREYSKAVAVCSVDFRGEKCNFYGLMKHMESTDRAERKEAFLAWAKMYEEVSPKLDAIYDKLVALRVKKAKKLGFKSYIDYVYLERERYDYNAGDVENFRKQVRDFIVPLCAEIYKKQADRIGIDRMHWYDEALVFPEGNANPIGSKDELVEKARKMYTEMSPETAEYFAYMVEHDLFDLETRPGKHMGGYCTFMPEEKAPFIFSNFNGTSADVDVLTHEAGHAFEAYTASRNLPFTGQAFSTSEINEIHSMAMEHFAYPWMDSFFGKNADKYRFAHLCGAITCIPYLVSVDEFQHRVFENPRMSAKERRAVWHEIETVYMPWRDYDGNAFLSEGGFWMQKQHIFLYPFYYVDYALAQTCAFQFFAKAEEDRKAAWNGYVELCKRGGSLGYFETLESAGLKNPFRDGTVEETMAVIRKILKEFESKL